MVHYTISLPGRGFRGAPERKGDKGGSSRLVTREESFPVRRLISHRKVADEFSKVMIPSRLVWSLLSEVFSTEMWSAPAEKERGSEIPALALELGNAGF